MQVDQNEIIKTFDRIEEEAGGLWKAMPSMTLGMTAIELNLPRDLVSAIMTSHWTKQGAG